MQPFISQALMATRVAEMHRQAETGRIALGLKRSRNRARRRAQTEPGRGAQPSPRPEHARLPAV